jgi:Cu(I)/Ag(I) efflux system membrane fusion protein
MKRTHRVLAVLAVIVTVGISGLLLRYHGVLPELRASAQTRAPSSPPSGPVIYYQDPEGKPLYSAEPAQTPDGRPYRAVRAGEDLSVNPPEKVTDPAPSAPAGKQIRYYRNPMGLPDVSRTPKKDSMGMDYIPVYEGDDEEGPAVKITPGKVQRLGVKTETAKRHVVSEPVRAPGTIQLDERRVAVISLRTEAFIDTVENVTTGTMVHEGQPLMRLYSPLISGVAADYITTTLSFKNDIASLRGAKQRLLNLGVAPSFIAELERTREVPLTFMWTAPRDGIVLERNVVPGMRAMPGDVLFRIADHSVVWALVDVAERDLGAVAAGQSVTVRVRSYPDKAFTGTVALVYPHLNSATRTVRVRIDLPNPDLLLLPDMYAQAEIETGGTDAVLAVPDDAIIDSGNRRVVILDKGDGRFEPRPIETGRRGAGYVEIKSGLAEGDVIVTSANFLIDAESNLKAAIAGFAAAPPGGAPDTPGAPAHKGH